MSPSSKTGMAQLPRQLMSGLVRPWQSLGRRAANWSLRPPENLATLFPDRLLIAKRRRGLHPTLEHSEMIRLAAATDGAPAWQPAVAALAEKVMDGTLSHGNVSLTLSSHFVHYVLVPWNKLLKSEADRLSYVRQRLVRVHGPAAEAWALRLSHGGRHQPSLACAVPQTFIDALDGVMEPVGRRYCSLQPHLMANFNRWRSRIGAQAGWFVAVEPGLACLALLQDGSWQSVRSVRLGAAGVEQLPEILAREHCLVDAPAGCDHVWVAAGDLPAAAALEKGPWKVENLQPKAHDGAASGMSAGDAVATGV